MPSDQLVDSGRCYHCHEDVPLNAQWSVEFDGEIKRLCCAGCEAVMSAIVEAGLADYYRFRGDAAVSGQLPAELESTLDALLIYDSPELSERYLQPLGASVETTSAQQPLKGVKTDLIVQDLRCGACVWLLERAVRRLPGVLSVTFNFSTSRGYVEFDPSMLNLSAILREMSTLGYRAVPFDIDARERQLQRESRRYSQRLFVAGIGMMQVMMYALPVYVAGVDELDADTEQLLRWASLALTLPVITYSAIPFFHGAWRDIRNLRPGMDVPVSIGLLLAFAISVQATFTGVGDIYYDSVSMFVFLLLGTRYLEWRTRRRAMRAIDDVTTSSPDTARLLCSRLERGGNTFPIDTNSSPEQVIPAARLQPGDIIRVDAGARVPVDSFVIAGRGSVDNALLTGESIPVGVQQGDSIAGGALLVGSPLTLEVRHQQAHSTLSTIQRLVERGGRHKPHSVLIADRVASVFVSVLLLITVVVFSCWWFIDANRALAVTISVLIVSCPCALSMATPAALAAATGRLLQRNILISRANALEQLAQVTDVVFDKTGTVTLGEPSISAVSSYNGMDQSTALSLAQWMEAGSAHPYAQAILDCKDAAAFDSVMSVYPELSLGDRSVIDHEVGSGVVVSLEGGRELRLGSAQWCKLTKEDILSAMSSQSSSLFVLSDVSYSGVATLLARFSVDDAVRPESASLMSSLVRRGYTLHLLSGDRAPVVTSVAESLCIKHHRSDASPGDKLTYLASLQAQGATVLMIGDGINDAPVLAHAEVSLALSSASSLAQTAADVISLKPGLQAVLPLLDKAQMTRRVMRQNISWAIIYNLVAIPVAAAGWLPAWGAALGMSMSSLLVALNALRLWSDRPEPESPSNHGRRSVWNRCIS
jgi:Cu2+-exporting ATPase